MLVVDDQLVFREVAREVIEATADFELVGEAAGGESGIAAAARLHPDLVLLDVRMPGMDCVEAAERMRAASPSSVVVLISVEDAKDLPDGVVSCGAAELVRKQDLGPALLRRVWQSHGQ